MMIQSKTPVREMRVIARSIEVTFEVTLENAALPRRERRELGQTRRRHFFLIAGRASAGPALIRR